MKTRRSKSFNRRSAKSHPFFNAPAIQLKERGDTPVSTFSDGNTSVNGLPPALQQNMESLSGIDLSKVQVHRNSADPAGLDALAYTQGENIHLAPGEERLLPHEAWHVVQQKQGRVKPTAQAATDITINDDPKLEAEADRMGAKANQSDHGAANKPILVKASMSSRGRQTVQRKVRISGGSKRVKEADYKKGGSKSGVGSRYLVSSLIKDKVKRVFTGAAEMEAYANGKVDYIGDVRTASGKTFWYRLPENRLTVLGEYHNDRKGNAEDVIVGLNTKRYKYEPINELAAISPIIRKNASTKKRLDKAHKTLAVAGLVDPVFDRALENIVIKAMTGAAIVRNEYIANNPAMMSLRARKEWKGRRSKSKYSYGERTALYMSFAIHISKDLAQKKLPAPKFIESSLIKTARALKKFYDANKAVLDKFKKDKDASDLIGIYELTKPGKFKNLSVLKDFTIAFHKYGADYINQLGMDSKNKKLETEGKALAGNLNAQIDDFSPAREAIMWQKVQEAEKGKFLIVGMGDLHRINMTSTLDGAGIPHAEVKASLKKQAQEVKAKWKR